MPDRSPDVQIYGEAEDRDADEKFQKTVKKLERELRSDIKNLIATELAMALYSPTPLQKLRHIFEAFEILNDEEQYAILSAEDIERVQRYRELTNDMGDLQKTDKNQGFIPFDFPMEQAPIYMDFYMNWYGGGFGAKTWDEYYRILATLLKSGEATQALCYEVKNAFINAAMPFALSVFRILFSEYIGTAELEAAMERIGAQAQGEQSDEA